MDRDNLSSSYRLIGDSAVMQEVQTLIKQVASTNATVLILGASGTGKELVAQAIHDLSKRAHMPFIPINCGAIPAELLESELFGHEKGAFTGAISSRKGRFELANEGTLFLDEIGDMPLPMQVKLLRVLQERYFERVGSNKRVDVDVRVIAATHRNLEQLIEDNTFREDLYYRLNIFPIVVPPLCERDDDVILLFEEMNERLKAQGHLGIKLNADASDILRTYHWPGNVRELANMVERLSILYPGQTIASEQIPKRYLVGNNEMTSLNSEREMIKKVFDTRLPNLGDGIDLKSYLVSIELDLIRQALVETDWVVAHAAELLSVQRTTLVEKIRKYNIKKPNKENSIN